MVETVSCSSVTVTFLVAGYAIRSGWGSNLNLGGAAQLQWNGWRGMLWDVFLQAVSHGPHVSPSDIFVMYLGGNDLAKCSGKALLIAIIQDLNLLKAEHPGMSILWSTMIPRMSWRADCSPQCVNKAHRQVNREVCHAVCKGLGTVIGHLDIHLDQLELFRSNGVHLLDLGMDLFLQDLQRGLCVVLYEVGRQGT